MPQRGRGGGEEEEVEKEVLTALAPDMW